MADLFAVLPSVGFAVLMIVGVFALMFWQHKQRAKIQRDTAEYQAGAIAQRLGIRVEKGDPNTNLFVNQGGLAQQSYDVLLRGERNGVPIEIVYFKKVWIESDWVSSTQYRQWQGQLTARTNARFGHFEVTLRQPQQWNRVRSFFAQPMQELSTGNARTDSMLRVTGDNPAIAGALGGLLEPLTRLNYVHVVGRDGEVSFLMSHSDAGMGNEMIGVGYALYDCETIFDVLTRIVLTAEGRA